MESGVVNKISALDGLRGLMAFWVWVTHVTTMATMPLLKHSGLGWVLANGSFAVGVFVILSGFVIGLNLSAEQKTSYIPFLIRRGFRLFPAYLFCLALSVILLYPSIEFLHNLPWDGPRTADRLKIFNDTADYYWAHLFLHILLLHGLFPDAILPSTSHAFMGQAWSLTLEWQFYLLAPFLFFWAGRFKLSFLLQLIILIILSLAAKFFRQQSFLPSLLHMFFIGYFCCRIMLERQKKILSSRKAMGMLVMQILIVSIFGLGTVSVLIWAVVFVGLLLRGAASNPILVILESRAAQWLGRVSYSFYCVHMVVMYAMGYFLVIVVDLQSRPIYMVALILGSLLITLVMSHLINVWLEQPAQNYGKLLARKLQTYSVGRNQFER